MSIQWMGLKRFVIASLTAATLWGCGGGGGGGRTPGDLTGTVTDVDGRVVPGATVAVGNNSTTSLSNGTFVLTGIKDGYVTVRAISDVNGVRWTGQNVVDLVGNYQNRSVNLILSQDSTQGSIGGSVIGPNGLGLVGCKIFIGGPFGSTLAVTDSNGNYQSDHLTPGVTYTVTASLAGFNNDTKSVHVASNTVSAASFALAIGSATGAIPAPQNLTAQAWTVADYVSRGTQNNGGLLTWLKKTYRTRAGLSNYQTSTKIDRKVATRGFPSGAVTEIDLFWTYKSYNNLFGYAINRASNPSLLASSQANAILRDPLANAFFDVDPDITPNSPMYYTISALDTVQFPDSSTQTVGPRSNVASANPLSPITAFSPSQGGFAGGNPTFQWSSISGAAGYQIYVWDRFPSLLDDITLPVDQNAVAPIWPANLNSPGSSFVYAPAASGVYGGPPLISGRTYYWMVVGQDSTSSASVHAISASPIMHFTVP